MSQHVFGTGEEAIDDKHQIEMQETVPKGEDSLPVIHASQAYGLTRGQVFRKYWKPIMFCLMCSFGATLDGYQQTIPGNIIANAGFIEQFGTVVGPDGVRALDADHVAAWGGALSGANICASLIGGFTTDWFGRKVNMAAMTLILAIAVVLEIVAKNWVVWLIAKLLAGFGNGFATSALVIYNAEIAPPQIRGFMLSTWAFFYALGQLTASIGLQIIAVSATPNDYKRSFYSEFVFTGLFAIFLVFLPETPWHYARKGQEANAKKSLRRLYGGIEGYDIDAEYEVICGEIEASIELSREGGKAKWSELFRGSDGRRFAISAAIPFYGQLSGAPIIFTYLTYFFQLAGLQDAFLASLIVFLILIVFIVVSWFTTDLIGRRPLLLGACLTCTLSLIAVGIAGTVPSTTASKNSLIVFACIWVVSYASGIAPVGSIYQGETATPRLRAKTNFLSAAFGGMFNLIFNYTVPLMLSPQKAGWGVKTGYFFAGTAALGGVIMFFLMPELKGREYSEIDELFRKGVPARKFRIAKSSLQLAAERPTA